MALFIYAALPGLVLRDAKGRLMRQAGEMAQFLGPLVAGRRAEEVRRWAAQVGEILGAHVCVFDEAGRPLARACPLSESLPEAPRASREMFRSPTWGVERTPFWGEPVVQVTVPIPSPEGGRAVGLLLVRQPLRVVREFQAAATRLLFVSIVAALLLSALLSLLLYRSLRRSLSPLRRALVRASSGDLSVRLPVRSQDEVGMLSASFNRLAERLERTIANLEEERARLEAVFEAMTDGVLSVGPDGRIRAANRTAEGALGGGLVGRKVGELPEGCRLLALLEEAKKGGASKWEELRVGDRFLLASASSLPRGTGFVIVLRDMTERRRMEEARRQFLADVSHELRTPLSRALARTEALLEEGGLAAEEVLKGIHRELLLMRDLISDLLDLASLEAGAASLKLEEVDLLEVAEEAVGRVAEEAERKKVTITLDMPEEVVVVADGARLLQVLTNLLDNAVRYNREGGRVWLRARERNKGVEISVEDTGPGIPPEERPLVFERFYKAKEGGGVGLGLAIVKRVVESHGGRIWVEEGSEGGARFVIRLPRRTRTDEAAGQ